MSTSAEVILDGTLGFSGSIAGPTYQIEAEVGQQWGNNLFHSFQEFNINAHEKVTFSGPTTVNSIISRVTGGNPSYINGLLTTTIPKADVYFLNPAGIFFGEGAQLDISGSFHASTADTLRLGTEGEFHAKQPSQSLLSIASPQAFGFLTEQPAVITLQNSQLSVSEGQTLSLIGGDLQFHSDYPPIYDNNRQPSFRAGLSAEQGRINLVSVASQGEVIPKPEGIELSHDLQNGTIEGQNIEINVNGAGGGNIFIRGQTIHLQNSQIRAQTLGPQKGGIIEIQADHLNLQQGARIEGSTHDRGKGSHIYLQISKNLLISGQNEGGNSGIFDNSRSLEETAGQAGNIEIEAHQIQIREGVIASTTYQGYAGELLIKATDVTLKEGAYISSATYGAGQGGNIVIQATGTVTIEGVSSKGWQSGITASSQPWVDLKGMKGGNGGNILLEANTLILKEGGKIDASTTTQTRADLQVASGDAGNITLRVSGLVQLSGVNPHGQNTEGFSSGIYVRSLGENAGKAGLIALITGELLLTDGAVITSSTTGTSEGGNMIVYVEGPISIVGDSKDRILKAPAIAQEYFQEQFPDLAENQIATSGIYANSESQQAAAGQAGNIAISAHNLKISQGGMINTSTQNAGNGSIIITTQDLLYLQEGQITTSVQGGKNNGGNITINHAKFVILDESLIKAQADIGKGGDIRINSNEFVVSKDSLVSASSRLGIDGNIVIKAPEKDVGSQLFTLHTRFLDINNLLQPQCRSQQFETKSIFSVNAKKNLFPSPDTFLSSGLLPSKNQKQTARDKLFSPQMPTTQSREIIVGTHHPVEFSELF